MKNRLYYAVAFVAIVFGLAINVDVRQSPPDPTCPFEPCDSVAK